MTEQKQKYAFWLTPEVKSMIETAYPLDAGCRSQSEFMERAVRFYAGHLAAEYSETYLPELLSAVLESHLTRFGDRLGQMLFKLQVEVDMCEHILAYDSDLTPESLTALRARCVNDVKRTNGKISFDEILKFQKDL